MENLLLYLLFSVGINLFLFLIAYLAQTDKLTDISYSLTFLALAGYSFFQSEMSLVDLILLIVIALWAFRLGSYLLIRIHKIGRDDRFDQIRNNFLSFFLFWLMQGLTCFVVLLPILLANDCGGKNITPLFIIGAMMAMIGLTLESIADLQKFRFKQKNPNDFMNKGLWSFLQHPNYTGELLFWWSLFVACVPFINGFYGIAGPLWISLIILRFSGIPILQEKWKKRYGDQKDFQNYQQNTPKIIPFIY